jgi:hypothetical protein
VFPFRCYAGALEHTAEGGIADADVFPLLKQFPKAGEIITDYSHPFRKAWTRETSLWIIDLWKAVFFAEFMLSS